MSGGQWGKRAALALGIGWIVAGSAPAGCSLDSTGTAPEDVVQPDRTDDGRDVRDSDADVEEPDDGTTGETPECLRNEDCGDVTCVDGSKWCIDQHCVEFPPMICPDDGVRCTKDYCVVSTNTCNHSKVDGWCPSGLPCDRLLGCVSPLACDTTADCAEDPPLPCTEERCIDTPAGKRCSYDAVDADGDGVGVAACGEPPRQGDCDDSNPDVAPDLPEVCNNGLDDDCYGGVDYLDTNPVPVACLSNLTNDLCSDAILLVGEVGAPHAAPVELKAEFGADGPATGCAAYEGPDAWYRLELGDTSEVQLDTIDAGMDTVLSLVESCEGDELLCNDNRRDAGIAGSRLVYRGIGPGTYFVRIAGNVSGAFGSFELHYLVRPVSTADCGNPIDATEGGTFYGHLTEDSPTDGGLCLWPNIGWKERFHAVVGTPANVNILTTGTTFDHVLHGREGACDPLDGPTPVLCTTAPAGEGTSEILPGFVGDLYITLEHNVGMFGDTPPDGPYVVEINM